MSLLITLDAGNSSIKVGIFSGTDMIQYARLSTDLKRTSDEYGMLLIDIFQYAGLQTSDVEGIVISSVVPSINYSLEHMCRTFFDKSPLFIEPGVRTGMNILYENPRELGSDRIVTAIAAYEKFGGPVIIVDFGTATTFGVVSEQGAFLGGAIMPGIRLSVDALVSTAAKLPKIELEAPDRAISRSTITNMQSGIIYGFTGAVDNIIRRMIEELGRNDVTVVATGGLGRLLSGKSVYIQHIDSRLTLEGLRIVYDRNRPREVPA
ncbi:MAG: type III pantothenate kinase [Clostridiales bacterium]|nr:type III pantothenate kinase [Clostridiales bacterium]